MEHCAVVLKAVSEVFPLERFRWAMIPSSKQNTDVNGKHTQALGWVMVRPASGDKAPPCPPAGPLCCPGPARGASGRAGDQTRGQSRGPLPGTGRAEKSRGAGRPRRGDSAARSTGLRPVFPVPLPPPRVLVCAGVGRGSRAKAPLHWRGGSRRWGHA